MAATRKKKTPKLTKKMLGNLDQAEIRCVLMEGMQVTPEQAFSNGNKWCIDYLYDNQDKFAAADLSDIHPGERFRHSVFGYILNLQRYLNGDIDAPSWPPEESSSAAAVVDEAETVPANTEPVEVPVERAVGLVPNGTYLEDHPPNTPEVEEGNLLDVTIKDYMESIGTNTTVDQLIEKVMAQPGIEENYHRAEVTEAVEEAASEAVAAFEEAVISARGKAIEAPMNTGAPKMTVAFTKVDAFGSFNEEPEPEAVATAVVGGLSDNDMNYFDETFTNLGERMDTNTDAALAKVSELEKKISSVENALLFVINSAILPKGTVIDSLDEIPAPPYE